MADERQLPAATLIESTIALTTLKALNRRCCVKERALKKEANKWQTDLMILTNL